jgi:enoyl-CoA hydratase
MTAEMIDAQEAYRIGLVNRVVPATELLPAATTMLRAILANGPLAVAACIGVLNHGVDLPLVDGLEIEAAMFGRLAGTADKREGTRAFLEKRAPSFKGT